MKKWVAALFFATLSTLLGAQTTAGEGQPDINVERARISAARATLEAGFLAEDAACYKKFAVNRCLDRVNIRRREAIADLRRQEILLNEEERRLRGAAQLRKLEEKAVEKQQDAAANPTKTQEDEASRLIREKKKSDDQAAARAREKTAIEASAARLKANQRKAQARVDSQAEAALAAEQLRARQKKAQERREQHERDRLKEIKPPAKSLPLPE
jgi:colicin import membrane protein